MDRDIEKKFIASMVGNRGNAFSTAKQYAYCIKLFQRRFSNLDQVTNENIVNYLADLRIKQQKNANTRRLAKTALETFFAWYSRQFGIPNPAVGLAQIRQYKSFPKLIHPDEVERMCFYEHKKNTDHSMRNSAIIAFFAMTGMRVGEFERLKLGNITRQPDHFTVLIPGQKGTYERIVQFGKFIPGTLVDYFNRYYLWVTTQKMQKKTNPLFFKMDFRKLHCEDMTAPVLRGSVDYLIRRAAYNAGIDRRITVHQLRHFYGTYSIVEGMNLFVLQQNMGHARIETTQRYVHIAGLMTEDTLKHSATSRLKSSPELPGYTELIRDLNKYTN